MWGQWPLTGRVCGRQNSRTQSPPANSVSTSPAPHKPVWSNLNERTQLCSRTSALSLCLKNTYIESLLHSRKESNPFSYPHPTLLVPLRLCLSASLRANPCRHSRTQSSPANSVSISPAPPKPVPNYVNERTQLRNVITPLNLWLPNTCITQCPRLQRNTNPILTAPTRATPAFEPNPIQTHIEPQPNPFRTHPHSLHPAHLAPLHPHIADLPAQNRAKTAKNRSKVIRNCKKPFKTASKRFENDP